MERWPYLRQENRPQFFWPVVSKAPYENYYGQVFWPDNRRCFWWRYTFLRTNDGPVIPRLWAAFFDANHPEKDCYESIVISPDEITTSARGLVFGDSGQYRLGHLDGAIGDRFVWNLDFQENTTVFPSVDIPLLGALLSSSRNISPNNNIRVRGSVRVHGEDMMCDDLPGHQGHTWGNLMPPGWVWSHCNAFARNDAVCELVALDKGDQPSIGSIYLKFNGREYLLNRFQQVLGRRFLIMPAERNTFSWDGITLTFSGADSDIRVEGRVTADPRQYHLVRYTNTDDSFLFNLNDSVAEMKLRIFQKSGSDWREPIVLTSEGAQIEFVSPHEPSADLCSAATGFGRHWYP